MATSERTYSDEEVQERLTKELPHWYLEDGWIRRRFRTNSWKGTLMVINTVGHLSEAAWHHPDITASYAWVEVRLKNHAAKGMGRAGRDARRGHALRLYQIRQTESLNSLKKRP